MVFKTRFLPRIPEKIPAPTTIREPCFLGKNQAYRRTAPGRAAMPNRKSGRSPMHGICPAYRTGSIPCYRGVGELEP